MGYRTKHALKRAVKQAAFWAAFFVVASIAVTLASFAGAEMAGVKDSQAIMGLAGLGMVIVMAIAIIGLLCALVEDRTW